MPANAPGKIAAENILQVAGETRWDEFARQDAYTYILTQAPRGDRRAFWESGEQAVASELFPIVEQTKIVPGTGLELGCGVGRLLLPMARRFQQVVGLDISGEMVRQGQELATQMGVTNAQFVRIDNPYALAQQLAELRGKIDFAYSLLVFQHIDDFSIVAAYLDALASLLAQDGVAYLQFDTRRRSLAYQAKTALPDSVLPRFWRRGIRRIRRSRSELETLFAKAGLQIMRSIAPDTERHCYLLRSNPR